MDTIKILILSLVQGITELLPISSSAHLILTGNFLNINISEDSGFLAILHLGTTLAIVIFFRKDLFKSFFTKEKLRFYLKLFLASIPVAIIGFLFEDYINSLLHGNKIIAISLIVVGILFIIIENIKIPSKEEHIEKIPFLKMFLMGVSQILALIPGTSRSGITTLTGMGLGLDKYTAFNFSFILGIPILLGSSLYQIVKLFLVTDNSIPIESLSFATVIPSIIMTFTVGYLALIIVRKFKKTKWLTGFGIYRIILGIIILLFAI